MAEPSTEDYKLVHAIYDRCWAKSRGRYNKWVPGRLTPQELTLYLAMNATVRAEMGGLPELALDERSRSCRRRRRSTSWA